MTLVSVEEYLNTSFQDGDREYLDGRLVEVNVGDVFHGDLQGSIVVRLRAAYPRFWTAPAVLVQVKRTRFRIPDVVVVAGPMPAGPVITAPPLVAIEILSPTDRAEELQEKIDEYLAFGIPCVWVVNPRTRRGYLYTADGMREAKDGILRTADPAIELPLAEVFPAPQPGSLP